MEKYLKSGGPARSLDTLGQAVGSLSGTGAGSKAASPV